jgi:photosystem II stability/assembly factor-like uncharacterized protein
MAHVRSSQPVNVPVHPTVSRASRRRVARILTLATLGLLVVVALPATAGAAFKPTSFGDIDFVSKSVGFAVATPGSLYATTNGGVSWSRRPMGNNDWLTGVDFVTSTRGWAISIFNQGEPGRIWHTQDGGRHWVQQANPTDCDFLNDIAFVSKQVGTIVGNYGTILRTVDGGATWQQVASGTTDSLGAVDFPTAMVGYATGVAGRILKTTNGGLTWAPLASGTTRDLRGVSFRSATLGWVVGANGTIRRTTNGGATWTKQQSGTAKALAGVDFVSGSAGWAVGSAGTILRTANGGRKWVKQASGTTAFLAAVDFVSATKGFVAGEKPRPAGSTPYAYGVIRRTITGGKVWLKSF